MNTYTLSPLSNCTNDTRQKTITVFHLLVVLIVAAGFLALHWIVTIPDRINDQRTVLVGNSRFTPGSDASVRVVVQDAVSGRPVEHARVKVGMKPAKGAGRTMPLFEGETDEAGTAPIQFHVPADAPAEAVLVVETSSDLGRDRVERSVTVERDYRLLLTTDKPFYQPGQTIHIRALALDTFDMAAAANVTVDFLVEDPKGNKVFRDSVTASGFGVTSVDFPLADMVNQGDYRLSASIQPAQDSQDSLVEGAVAEKTVEVRPYVLPKFGVDVSTERSFYLPGQRVEGKVQADYFFDKPVSEGEVRIVGSVWDVERKEVVDLQGQTDAAGTYEFSFDLPEYSAGSGLESGQARFALEVTVIDQADHAEQVSQVIPIAAQPLVIEAIPESGVLKPGVENVVYVLTSYPDGRLAQATLDIRVNEGDVLATIRRDTNAFGVAEFSFTSPVDKAGDSHFFEILAQNERGESARRRVTLESARETNSILLRSDRVAYVVGETMELMALTAVRPGSIYLDVVKGGQTLSTRSAQVKNDDVQGPAARFTVDVTPEMYGEIELHAYKVLLDGTIVRDTRLIAVDAPTDLSVGIRADRETYLPGDTASIGFDVEGQGGEGIPVALGVAVVDESVFALERQDPGFAKLYFLLRQELMDPFVQVQGFDLLASSPSESQEEALRQAQDGAAKASWASVPAVASLRSTDSRQEKVAAAQSRQREGFKRLGQIASVGLILIPLGLWAVTLVALKRAGVVRQSLKRLVVSSIILLLIGGLLAYGLVEMPYNLENVVGELLIALSGLGVLALAGYAWVRRDPAAKSLFLLTLAWGATILLLVMTADRGEISEGLALASLLSYLLIPGAYLLFGQGRWLQERRFAGTLVTGLGALSALPAMGLLLAIPTVAFGGLRMGAPTTDLAPKAQLQVFGNTGRTWDGENVNEFVEKEAEVEEAAPAAVPNEREKAGEAPRLRQWFPETLYWAPDVQTDDQGQVELDIPMADSITTWRLTALASSRDGRLGFATRGLRVFQDFFVDVDLPVSLTQGDEISIPVGVFNYLPEAQEVRLVVESQGAGEEDWFELLGEKEQTLTIASKDVEVVYFPIRVLRFGRHGFQVTAWGEKMSDAIRREVDVVPNGKEVRLTESDWLRGDCEVELGISPKVIPETSRVEVKVYPGVLAQVVEGLEKILRLPHG